MLRQQLREKRGTLLLESGRIERREADELLRQRDGIDRHAGDPPAGRLRQRRAVRIDSAGSVPDLTRIYVNAAA
ncbi:hypothetical protein GCM10007890_30260 [Methylobacterium tardum]|uniref:Uncharacterized protein n=1 Tax=Methylobacterium tardum TaxID=374432 RepID=A0AA37TMY4_9HYPH|nr:hypothetical protein GCM10007890_30260 [Methylobacterium tardum]